MNNTRRIPTQSRSKEKYQQIISTAKELIGNKGNDSVSMREISKHSGVALASIYQYFPDKNAILQAIMEEFFEQIRGTIVQAMESCETLEELIERTNIGVDLFYEMFKKDPVFAILWAGLQANPTLSEYDVQDSKKNAKIIGDKICSLVKDINQEEVFSSTLLLVHMLGSTIRLALTLPEEEGKQIIREVKVLIRLRLSPFMPND